MGSKCSCFPKRPPSLPEEFKEQVAQLQKVRESTLEIVVQFEKIYPRGIQAKFETATDKGKKKDEQKQMSILEQLANTSLKFGTTFAGHNYGAQLERFSTACKKLSKYSIDTQKKIEEEVINPMRKWANEGYDAMIKELVKCRAMQNEVKRAEKLLATKPGEGNKAKAEAVKKALEFQRGQCRRQIEAIQKGFLEQMKYIERFIYYLSMDSRYADVTLDNALIHNITVQSTRN